MKLTSKKLKQIIKEELGKILERDSTFNALDFRKRKRPTGDKEDWWKTKADISMEQERELKLINSLKTTGGLGREIIKILQKDFCENGASKDELKDALEKKFKNVYKISYTLDDKQFFEAHQWAKNNKFIIFWRQRAYEARCLPDDARRLGTGFINENDF